MEPNETTEKDKESKKISVNRRKPESASGINSVGGTTEVIPGEIYQDWQKITDDLAQGKHLKGKRY